MGLGTSGETETGIIIMASCTLFQDEASSTVVNSTKPVDRGTTEADRKGENSSCGAEA